MAYNEIIFGFPARAGVNPTKETREGTVDGPPRARGGEASTGSSNPTHTGQRDEPRSSGVLPSFAPGRRPGPRFWLPGLFLGPSRRPGAAARSPIWLPRPVLGTRGGDRVPNSASWACSRDPSFAPGRRPGPRFGSLACSRIFDQRLHDPCGGRKKPAVQNGDPPKRPRADHLLEKNSAAAREAGRPGHRQRNEIGRRLDADADATAPLDDVENDRAIAGPEVDEHIIGTDRS